MNQYYTNSKPQRKNTKLGWYLLCVSVGATLGIAFYNKIGWIL